MAIDQQPHRNSQFRAAGGHWKLKQMQKMGREHLGGGFERGADALEVVQIDARVVERLL
jgi:hypothetical protein